MELNAEDPRVSGRAASEARYPSGDVRRALELDLEATADRLCEQVAEAVRGLGRRGAVVAVSGGIDSAVVAALCVRALGPKRVLLLRLPERDIGTGASDLGLELAEALGAPTEEESITAALDGLGCYRRRDAAIRAVFPDYEPHWRHKLVRSPPGGVIVFSLVVERPDGREERRRMPPQAYRAIVAATNLKQRVRKVLEYTRADELGYAVLGTPNLLEYDQGFFVKGGDGLADVKPIAGLYKQQVYALAPLLGVPPSIAERAPTTETFSLPQSQEEFYFGHPHERMDVLLWGERHGVAPGSLAPQLDVDARDVEDAYAEIERRRTATAYLHAPAVLLSPDGP